MFEHLFEQILNELTFNDLDRKQASITKLHPQFYNRVKSVAQRGGIKLDEMLPELWHFKVASGTKEGVKYDVYVRFANTAEILKKWVFNRKMWLKDDSRVDVRKLAAEVINDVDFQMSCTCPASLYYGSDYILTQRDAKYGSQEQRPPKIRNPKQYGAFCKHTQLVMDQLPFYTSTFATWLNKYWKEEIVDLEEEFKKQLSAVSQATKALAGKKEVPQGETPAPKQPEISTETGQGEEIPAKEEPTTGDLKQATKNANLPASKPGNKKATTSNG